MKMLTLALILISFSGLSQARSRDHNRYSDHSRYNSGYFWQDIERRQHNQYSLVNHGVERGLLTRREIKRLKRERKHLARKVRHYRRNKYLNHSDKRDILRRFDYYSDQIYNLKHNKQYSRRNGHNYPQYERHSNRRNYQQYGRHSNRRNYQQYGGHSNRRNYKLGRVGLSSRNKHQYYRNNNFESGLYFRF